MNEFAPHTARASLEVARVALERMAGAPPPPSAPRALPVTMAVRAGEAWTGVEHVLQAVIGRNELVGPALLAEARRLDVLDMDGMHALVALREWVERTLAPGSAAQVLTLAPTEAEKEVAQQALHALTRVTGTRDTPPEFSPPLSDHRSTTQTATEVPPAPLPPVPSQWAPQPTRGDPSPAESAVGASPFAPRTGARGAASAPNVQSTRSATESAPGTAKNGANISAINHAVPVDVVPRSRSRSSALIMGALAMVVVLAGVGAWYALTGRSVFGASATEQGVAAYSRGAKEAARLAFVQALDKNPDDVRALTYLGRISRELGNLATARKYLENAIRIDPNNALALREFGAALLADQQPELARRFYVRAVQADPSDRAAQGFLGCTLMRLGRVDEAANWLARAGTGEWSGCTGAGLPSAAPPAAKD